VIPSPAVSPGTGDEVVRLRGDADRSATARAATRARSAAHRRAEARRRAAAEARAEHAHHKPAPRPTAAPKPKPTPPPASPVAPVPDPTPSPVPVTVQGPVVAGAAGWSVGTVPLTPADLVSLPRADVDADGQVETTPQEMAGLAASRVVVTLTYRVGPPLVVVSLVVG
jgi:hypothetical protein